MCDCLSQPICFSMSDQSKIEAVIGKQSSTYSKCPGGGVSCSLYVRPVNLFFSQT